MIDLFLPNEKGHPADEADDGEDALERPETTFLNPSHFVATGKNIKQRFF